MFHFGTDHTNQERRDGFVSFRCFLCCEEEEGERTLRGGNWDFRRMGEDFERTKEDGRGRERDSENEENGTLNRRKQRL